MYDSLHRNLRLWSVTPNESSFGKIGHDESGSKQEFISFYNFLATVKVMLYKICNKLNCNELIPQTETYCTNHRIITKERHKAYDKSLRDKKSKAFYNSVEWRVTQAEALRKYNHIDLYDYYMNNKLSVATTAHHITELKDDWNKRLDIDNLFPCTVSTHSVIHKFYKKDIAGTQKLLRELMERFKIEFM